MCLKYPKILGLRSVLRTLDALCLGCIQLHFFIEPFKDILPVILFASGAPKDICHRSKDTLPWEHPRTLGAIQRCFCLRCIQEHFALDPSKNTLPLFTLHETVWEHWMHFAMDVSRTLPWMYQWKLYFHALCLGHIQAHISLDMSKVTLHLIHPRTLCIKRHFSLNACMATVDTSLASIASTTAVDASPRETFTTWYFTFICCKYVS